MIQAIIYYSILYIIVIVVSYFKIKREFKEQDPSVPAVKFNWRKVFFVSTEVIYTASGVVIILLEKQRDWVGPLIALLLLLSLVSTNLDGMSEKFSDTFKFRVHVIVMIVVIAGTMLTYINHLDIEAPEGGQEAFNNRVDSMHDYDVAIPYSDKSLVNHIGYEKFGDCRLVYRTQVMASNQEEAESLAIKRFWNDSTILPLYTIKGYDNGKKSLLKIDTQSILVKEN